jgi:endonuclease YncB( thermonuclease family)
MRQALSLLRVLFFGFVLPSLPLTLWAQDFSARGQAKMPSGREGKEEGVIEARVARVVNGHTIELVTGVRLRLIGVDAPDAENPERNSDTARRLGLSVERFTAFADESSKFLRELIKKGDVVWLRDPVHEPIAHRDAQGEMLAYVYGPAKSYDYVQFSLVMKPRHYEELSEGKYHMNFNATMIRAGFAAANLQFPFRQREQYLQFQEEAQKFKRGIWQG